MLTSPEAVNLQAASETAYEGFDAEKAEKADSEAFPVVFDEPAGGPPRLPEGEHIAGFVGAYTAQVEDVVHITPPAIVATQGFEFATPVGSIPPAFWDVETSFWLKRRFTGARLVETVDEA